MRLDEWLRVIFVIVLVCAVGVGLIESRYLTDLVRGGGICLEVSGVCFFANGLGFGARSL